MTDPDYVMGHTSEETQRLQKQSRLYNSSTRRLFEDAGLAPGMRVLDVGSGAGDVALVAATLVGPSGTVVGVDTNPAILDTARERCHAAGFANISFVEADARTAELGDDFDAIVGRLVLVYSTDAASLLRELIKRLRARGIVAFQDIDWTSGPLAVPPSRLLEQAWRWAPEVFRRAGLDPQTGLNLHRIFVDAGLPAPTMHLYAPAGGGSDFAGYDYMASGIRSNLPHILKFGIATAEEVGIDNYAERLRAETIAQNGVITLPTFVGAWARNPQSTLRRGRQS